MSIAASAENTMKILEVNQDNNKDNDNVLKNNCEEEKDKIFFKTGKKRAKIADANYQILNQENQLIDMKTFLLQKIIDDNMNLFRAYSNCYYWFKNKYYFFLRLPGIEIYIQYNFLFSLRGCNLFFRRNSADNNHLLPCFPSWRKVFVLLIFTSAINIVLSDC